MKKWLGVIMIGWLVTPGISAQDWAKARLEKSPRHLEWVKIKQGNREISSFIAYPEVKEKATAVVVIHEIFGLTDWVRGVADQLAEAGYIAIAPDLLSETAPGGGGTSELGGNDAVRKAISSLAHGFMRAGEAPDASPANKEARDKSWQRLKEILQKI